MKNHKDEVDFAFFDAKLATFEVCKDIKNNFFDGIITQDFFLALEKIKEEMDR